MAHQQGNPLYDDFGLGTLEATNGAVAHSVMPAGQAEGAERNRPALSLPCAAAALCYIHNAHAER